MKKFVVHSSVFIVFLLSTLYYLPFTSFAQETPTPSLTISPRQLSPDEQAMGNFNQSLLPKEAVRTKPSGDNSFLNLIKNSVTGFFSIILNKISFTAQSESVHQAYLPNELRPEYKEIETKKNQASDIPVLGITTSSPLEALTNLLGGSTGFYGVSLPKEVQSKDIKESEQAFEKAYFPEGINPITEK